MKRVLHLIHALEPCSALNQVLCLARGLDPAAFSSEVCVLQGEGSPEGRWREPALPFHFVRARGNGDAAALLRLKRLLDRLRPDVLHCWSSPADHWGQLAGRLAGIPLRITSGADAAASASGARRLIARGALRLADRVVADCPALADRYREWGVAAEKVAMIPPAVAPPAASHAERADLLAELGLPAHVRLVGTIGRLRPEYGLKDLIWATDMIKFIRDELHLVVIGQGPHRSRLERFRTHVHIDDKVHFLGMRWNADRWLPHFDAFWSARRVPGVPLAMLEAMAAGVPVVTTRVAGCKEWIRHGENGFLVPEGDRAGIARLTNKMLDDAALQRRIGDQGRASVLERFAPAAMLAQTAALYAATSRQPAIV
jgi:glycosyltransferase involved in cell wall biosynthesis